MSTPTMDDHPHRALFDQCPEAQRRYIRADTCPGCNRPLRAFGEFITLSDPTTDPPLVALSAICWRCKHRLEASPKRRQEILTSIHRTMRLVVDVGGTA